MNLAFIPNGNTEQALRNKGLFGDYSRPNQIPLINFFSGPTTKALNFFQKCLD